MEDFIKHSLISTIVMLAEKIHGRGKLCNLIQYKYEEMIKHSLEELERMRDGHLNAYNQILKN